MSRTFSTRLFGSDGVRGRAGEYPLDRTTIRRLGAALVRALEKADAANSRERGIKILLGRDTRESGVWIEGEFAAGVASQGGTATSVGIVPTPAIAYLTRQLNYSAGVVISASHNPYEDNGIMVFSGRGEKVGESVESEVERIVADTSWTVAPVAATLESSGDLLHHYVEHLKQILGDAGPLQGSRIVVDVANGATCTIAPKLFSDLGFDVIAISDDPNGRNINLNCGSTHLENIQARVTQEHASLGVAFDGDGDRAIFVDSSGKIVDGDPVLLMCAKQMKAEGRLRGNTIVATVMSGIGLELALRDSGIELIRCAVGDKYVMEELIRRNLALGGEQSGHIIFSEYLFTGDGLATALSVLRTMRATGRTLGDLAAGLTTYPQILINVRVRERVDLSGVPEIASVLSSVESRIAGQGRLLARYSGTEPLLRVMIEGRHEDEIRRWAQEIAEVIRRHIG